MEFEPEYMAKARAQLSTGLQGSPTKGYADVRLAGEITAAPFAQRLLGMIEEAQLLTSGVNGNLSELDYRLFGNGATDASNANKEAPEPSSIEGQVFTRMVRLLAYLRTAQDFATGLNSRI